MRYENYGNIFFKPVIWSLSNRATTVQISNVSLRTDVYLNWTIVKRDLYPGIIANRGAIAD